MSESSIHFSCHTKISRHFLNVLKIRCNILQNPVFCYKYCEPKIFFFIKNQATHNKEAVATMQPNWMWIVGKSALQWPCNPLKRWSDRCSVRLPFIWFQKEIHNNLYTTIQKQNGKLQHQSSMNLYFHILSPDSCHFASDKLPFLILHSYSINNLIITVFLYRQSVLTADQ